MMQLHIDDTFNQQLPADNNTTNARRQVLGAAFSYATPRTPSNPKLVHVSTYMATAIGLSEKEIQSDDFLQFFSGAAVLPNTQPYAMCYGGHQFGHWAGQLGDGRAINLCEVVHQDQRWALQLKGAGETPYSRNADGLAVLRSSIREHLCSEAMYYLGVPTTRSLSLIKTGDQVLRDMLYDGNAAYETGAVVCRVAPSFIRFGNFQIFAARRDTDNLKRLADYTIQHFFTDIDVNAPDKYTLFYSKVAQRTLQMVIHWQRVGFVHGVMNTDNMSILGLTIDYGPYGWLEGYDPNWTPNTTDRQYKRYRYGYQPRIAMWNLVQLANAIYPLINDSTVFETVLDQFQNDFLSQKQKMMAQKLGLLGEQDSDGELIHILERLLQLTETDMTIFFRNLAKLDIDNPALNVIRDAFYDLSAVTGDIEENWMAWLQAYAERLRKQNDTSVQRQKRMHQVNPKYVLRNYMAQLAIDAAEKGDYSILNELHELLKFPYAEQAQHQKWFAKRPEWARHKVGCSMLSCSS